MQTQLADFVRDTPEGRDAHAILSRCVHCGFCTAACPTYRVRGDELDGPRGRIYLVKQVLEGAPATAKTQLHLDRCLTCRACEPACPSGVEYGRLVDIGRGVVEARVPRARRVRVLRWLLRETLTRPRLFGALVRLGRAVRPLLPAALRTKLPPRGVPREFAVAPAARAAPGSGPAIPAQVPRRMLLPAGCVQPALLPDVDAATVRVLRALGIEAIVPRGGGCCGALRHHLEDRDGALDEVRRNVDAWWPYVQEGVEAVVANASGCGAMVRDYAHLLRDDPVRAPRAARIVALARDLSEIVADHAPQLAALAPAANAPRPRIAFHPPCTLQHGQRLTGRVEPLLAALGAEVVRFPDATLCCGSAGVYSVLQPALATELRDRKLAALDGVRPDLVLSANVGCIAHLAGAERLPVRHWIEWVDEMLVGRGP